MPPIRRIWTRSVFAFCRSSAEDTIEFAGSNVVRVGVLLPLSGSWKRGDARGTRIAGAVMLAVQDVNSDLSLLDGKTLQYVYADSGCGSLESMDALKSLESMDANTSLTDRPLDAVMGPACSLGCESSAYSLRKSKIPQVSFGCSDPSLTGKKNPTVRVCIASCSPHLHLMGLS